MKREGKKTEKKLPFFSNKNNKPIEEEELQPIENIDELKEMTMQDISLSLQKMTNAYVDLKLQERKISRNYNEVKTKIKSIWKYLYIAEPELNKIIARDYGVDFEEEEDFENLNKPEKVLEAIEKAVFYPPNGNQLLNIIQELEEKYAETKRNLEEVKQALEVEKTKKKVVHIKGEGVKIVEKKVLVTPTLERVEEKAPLLPKVEKVSQPIIKKEIETKKKVQDVVLDFPYVTHLKKHHIQFVQAKNPTFDLDIIHDDGKVIPLKYIDKAPSKEEEFEQLMNETDNIHFVLKHDDVFKEFNKKFTTWLINSGKINKVEYSFTQESKLEKSGLSPLEKF